MYVIMSTVSNHGFSTSFDFDLEQWRSSLGYLGFCQRSPVGQIPF
eukprot:09988.XXX_201121_201255_1 [CDS] Oithona nana genome sequencing.